MKIAMFGQKGVPNTFGGVETHVTELATRLVRQGYAVTAYARRWYAPQGGMFNGIRVVVLPSVKTKHLDAITHTFVALLHAFLFVRPTIYHFHGVGPALLAWMPRVLAPRATVISTFHCVDRNQAKWGVFARACLKLGEWCSVHFAHETIVVGKSLAEYVEHTYGVQATYIPNGVTPRRVATDPKLLEPFALEPFHYVVMVSRLVPHKGAHTLIEAWQAARAANPETMKHLKLAIVGDSSFTDAYVRKLHAQVGTDKSIVFTGYQNGETLEALFAGARFVVHPSVSEGLPIAVLEAMSYGKAVIAANIPEVAEVVRDYGVLFAPGNAALLAQEIMALAADPMEAASLGHVARIQVEDAYHWDTIGVDTARLYERYATVPKRVLATQ